MTHVLVSSGNPMRISSTTCIRFNLKANPGLAKAVAGDARFQRRLGFPDDDCHDTHMSTNDEWLRNLIDQFLRTQLEKGVISVRHNAAVLKRYAAEFGNRFAEQPDQFGFAEFRDGWRYLGEAKWEVKRDLGEPNALAILRQFDREERLLKFRLISGEDDKVVKYLDLCTAPKTTSLPNFQMED